MKSLKKSKHADTAPDIIDLTASFARGLGSHHPAGSTANAFITNLQEFNRRIHLHIAAINSASNAVAPLHNLPKELITRIFHFALQAGGLSGYLVRLLRLAKVCKTWKALVDDTPALWGVLCASDPPEALQLALTKSKECLVDVSIDVDGGVLRTGSRPPFDAFDNFLNISLDASQRWRSVDFRFFRHASFLSEVEKRLAESKGQPFPKLQDLSVISDQDMDISLFREEASQLRHVHLHRIQTPWCWSQIHNLHTLDLDDLCGRSINVDDLLDVLRASPDLSSLTISSFVDYPGHEDPHSVVAPVSLAQLRRFQLKVPPAVTARLLNQLRTPNCSYFDIDCTTYPRSPHNILQPSMHHLFPSFHSIHTNLYVDNNQFSLEVASRSGKNIFAVSLDTQETMGPMGWVVESLQQLPCQPRVTQCIRTSPYNLPSALVMVRSTVNVRMLQVVGAKNSAAVVAALSEPIVVDRVALWPLPALEELIVIDSYLHPRKLRRMLVRRRGEHDLEDPDGVRDGPRPIILPAPLRQLHSCERESVNYKQLVEEEVGPEGVYMGTQWAVEDHSEVEESDLDSDATHYSGTEEEGSDED